MIFQNTPCASSFISDCVSVMDETTTNERMPTLKGFEEAMVNILYVCLGLWHICWRSVVVCLHSPLLNDRPLTQLGFSESRLRNDKAKARLLQSVVVRCTPISSLRARFTDPAEALNYSLQLLASALRVRIARKEEKARKQPRELQLMRVLGSGRYEEAKYLVRTIKMLRLSRGESACTGWGPCSKQPSPPTVIPSPASQLFFYTLLPKVMEGAPPESFADQDWENLMKQARGAIREYTEWSDEFDVQKIAPVQNQESFTPQSLQSKRMFETAPVLIEDVDDAAPSIHPLPLEPSAKRRRL
jgi:hypothetical protein